MSATQSMCRTCRKKQRATSKKVPVETQDLNGKSIVDMIYEITDIMVTFDSHLPQAICPNCLDQLRAAYVFRQKCIESNAILLEMFPQPTATTTTKVNVKNEFETQGSMLFKVENSDTDTMMSIEDDDEFDVIECDVDEPFEASIAGPSKTKKVLQKPRNPRIEGLGQGAGRKRTFGEIVSEYVKVVDKKFCCAIDELSRCSYRQDHFDKGNFTRHMRTQHPEHAEEKGLFRQSDEVTAEKPRKKGTIAKRGVAINMQILVVASIKLVAVHNLPVNFSEWEGFQMLLRPLIESIGVNIYSHMVQHISRAADRINEQIRKELRQKLVSIKLDFASMHGKHVLSVSAQFELRRRVVSRSLGTIEVEEDSTAAQLRTKFANVLRCYELTNDQIFAIIVDNGANTIASVEKLRKAFADAVVRTIGEADDSDGLGKEEELLEALSAELRNQFNVVRGATNNLQLTMNDIVPDSDPRIARVKEFVKKVRDTKYKGFFELKNAKYPPLLSKNHWSGKFKMVRRIVKQETFFITLGQKHPEIALDANDWQFLQDYHEAFLPLHNLTKLVQKDYKPFSEFYMQWLVAIKDLRNKTSNPFSKPLMESLTRRLIQLKENMVFKAALYLDPRFNHLNSVVFTVEQREEIQSYIVNIWNRMSNLISSGSSSPSSAAKADEPKSAASSNTDDMDDFLTELFGGSAGPAQSTKTELVKPVVKQLKSLELEPRQPHNYDVWSHWLMRQASHPELFAVAMVVLTIPSNSISLQQTFGALMLPNRDNTDSGPAGEDLLAVKLNRSLFERLAHDLYDWKKIGVKEA